MFCANVCSRLLTNDLPAILSALKHVNQRRVNVCEIEVHADGCRRNQFTFFRRRNWQCGVTRDNGDRRERRCNFARLTASRRLRIYEHLAQNISQTEFTLWGVAPYARINISTCLWYRAGVLLFSLSKHKHTNNIPY